MFGIYPEVYEISKISRTGAQVTLMYESDDLELDEENREGFIKNTK